MNEEPNKLREIVERATAPGKRIPGDLDAETASLRRGWLELGRLIEDDVQSGGRHNDTKLGAEFAGFERAISAAPNGINAAPMAASSLGRASSGKIPAHRRSRVWSYLLMAAASLLIGVGLAVAFRFMPNQRPQQDPTPVATDIGPKNQLHEPVVKSPDDGDELIALTDDSVKRITSLSRATMVVVVPFSLF